MAENESKDNEESPKKARPKKQGLWARLKLRNWAAMVIGTSVLAHLIMLALYPVLFKRGEVVSAEVDLGEYVYVSEAGKSELERAEFSLYVNLLTEIDRLARDRILQKKFRIRQDVEELLRQAHASDFEDPTLTELKRQLQEKINDALEMRAIESVIVTRLTLIRDGDASAANASSRGSRSKSDEPDPPASTAQAKGPSESAAKSTEPPDTLPELPESKKG